MNYRYYLTQRGPGPFCQPKQTINTHDYGIKTFIVAIGCKAWGYACYEHKLKDEYIQEYELVEGIDD